MIKGKNAKIKKDSGSVKLSGTIASLLYELMRDHVPPGIIEEVVRHVEAEGAEDIQCCNGWLGLYANYLALRLEKKS